MTARTPEARSTQFYKLKNISKWLCLLFIFGWLSAPAVTGDESGNGITVGEPKVFDNRSLASMIEQFEESLSASGFVSKNDLAAAIGNYQGSETRDSSQTLQISTLPTPQITTTSSATNGSLSPTSQTNTTNSESTRIAKPK